ncbi:MAG: hypothetical protein IPK87_08260 [Planctomycetes bacterium]|nr:hypothetical protein [Planctomycetota bacterium]
MVRKHLPLIAFAGLVFGPPVTGVVVDRLGGPGWAVGLLTFFGMCLLLVGWSTVNAVRHHLRQRVELIRSLENLRWVAAGGPPPLAGPASAVILLIVAVPFLLLATALAGSDDSGEVVAGAIPLAISLCAQLAAGWRLREWHLRRTAWREALAHGEVKGRWRAFR